MTKIIEVRQQVSITVDESRFTPEFMEEFRKNFFDFNTIDAHVRYIAAAVARGTVFYDDDFLEGYGELDAFGISFEIQDIESEVVE